MILYFTGALVLGYVLIQLSSYATVIAMISTGAKVIMVLFLVTALVKLYKKFKGTPKIPRLPWLSDK